MTNDNLAVVPAIRSIELFEVEIPVRGCQFDLEGIKQAYIGLHRINREHGQRMVSELTKVAEMTDEEWAKHQVDLLDNAFRLSVTITGQHDQRVHDEDSEIFTSDNLPKPIKSIYFNNMAAFRRNANGERPQNRIEVFWTSTNPKCLIQIRLYLKQH